MVVEQTPEIPEVLGVSEATAYQIQMFDYLGTSRHISSVVPFTSDSKASREFPEESSLILSLRRVPHH